MNANRLAKPPVTIAGLSDVSAFGTYFGSWAPQDGGASNSPVNGVTFQGFSDLPGFRAGPTLDNGYDAFGSDGSGPGQYIIGTFLVGGSGAQTVILTPFSAGLNPDPQINLLQVRDITSTLASAPTIINFVVRAPTLTITATSGPANGAFTLLATADITLPLAQWSPVLTNSFDGSGAINLVTNVVDPAKPNQFYILRTQR